MTFRIVHYRGTKSSLYLRQHQIFDMRAAGYSKFRWHQFRFVNVLRECPLRILSHWPIAPSSRRDRKPSGPLRTIFTGTAEIHRGLVPVKYVSTQLNQDFSMSDKWISTGIDSCCRRLNRAGRINLHRLLIKHLTSLSSFFPLWTLSSLYYLENSVDSTEFSR